MLSPEGGREASVEVTTDNAPKRGLEVEAKHWEGWLYSGGHAMLCSQQVGDQLGTNISCLPEAVHSDDPGRQQQHTLQGVTGGVAQSLARDASSVGAVAGPQPFKLGGCLWMAAYVCGGVCRCW